MKVIFKNLVRKNVLALAPYSSARDEFTEVADVYIDANENPYNWDYNRYPDPYQQTLKNAISEWKNVPAENLFLGNGSDEIIDLLIRGFCEPQIDQILTFNPSYGMYNVSADINHVAVRTFPLDENFEFDRDEFIRKIEPNDKLIFICSPNNPSGNTYSNEDIISICNRFSGLVVVDEAYIDFADTRSMVSYIRQIPNLVVMQTLSKAMGAAGIRLGIGFMDIELVTILNKIKPPYNINEASQKIALSIVKNRKEKMAQVSEILNERAKVTDQISHYKFVKKVFPTEANFVLVRVDDADHLYRYLLSKGIVARNRNKQFRCEGCIRFTIGTPSENQVLMNALNEYQNQN